MPTYQYACTDCDHAFEQVQSFSDDSLTTCPQCQGRLRKIFNAVGVVFKGSGFYRTDSRSDARAETGKAEAGNADKGKAGTESAGKGSAPDGSKNGTSTTKSDSTPAKSGAGASTPGAA